MKFNKVSENQYYSDPESFLIVHSGEDYKVYQRDSRGKYSYYILTAPSMDEVIRRLGVKKEA